MKLRNIFISEFIPKRSYKTEITNGYVYNDLSDRSFHVYCFSDTACVIEEEVEKINISTSDGNPEIIEHNDSLENNVQNEWS